MRVNIYIKENLYEQLFALQKVLQFASYSSTCVHFIKLGMLYYNEHQKEMAKLKGKLKELEV